MNDRANAVIADYQRKYWFIQQVAEQLRQATEMLLEAVATRNKILVCGNGGSNSDADHIVGELLKGFNMKRSLTKEEREHLAEFGERGKRLAENTQGAISAINLGCHTSLMTAVINDLGGEYVFSQQVMGLGRSGDILLGISTSGNSQDILNAAVIARTKGLLVIGLTGSSGGRLKKLCDCCICVPSDLTPDIQDMHTSVYHAICAAVEAEYWTA